MACYLWFKSWRQSASQVARLKHWKSIQLSNTSLVNLGDPKDQIFPSSALICLKNFFQNRTVSKESERPRCLVFIHLVKINTLKVNWNLSNFIKIINKTLGQKLTVLVSEGIRGDKSPHLWSILRWVAAMEITAKKMQTTRRMTWT